MYSTGTTFAIHATQFTKPKVVGNYLRLNAHFDCVS